MVLVINDVTSIESCVLLSRRGNNESAHNRRALLVLLTLFSFHGDVAMIYA